MRFQNKQKALTTDGIVGESRLQNQGQGLESRQESQQGLGRGQAKKTSQPR